MGATNNFFSVMVIGDDPDKIMGQYNINLKVSPYVMYRYKDAAKMQKNTLKVIDEILKNPSNFGLNDFQIDYFKERKKNITNMSSFEYYQMVTNGLYYDENGDALSEVNPKGKWATYQIGKNFSLPLKLKNGKEAYQAINKDVDWNAMHMQNIDSYKIVWELVHDERKPQTDDEKHIYEVMKDKVNYFSNFTSKGEYAIYNCAYWNYAYVDETNGWHDMDSDGIKDIDWIKNFFDKYVKNIKPDDKITICECTKKLNV